MKSFLRALAALAVVASFFLVAPSAANAAFGISPPFMNADHLVPGVTYTQTVYLVQDQPDQNLPIKATLSVPANIASWITLDSGFNFVIPEGTHQFPVVISVHVPSGEGLGKYSGNLSFTSQPTQTGQVSIALGANVAINLAVGNGIFEQFSVPLITFPDIEEGWAPQVYVKFENDGNVSEAFDGATLAIFDQYDNNQLAYVQKQDGFPTTPAFTTQGYTISFPTDLHLGIGDYWGAVTLYQNGKVIASQKAIFHVLPAGSISGVWGRFTHFLANNVWVYYATGALIVIIVGALFVFRRKKKARRGV
jgi:hypothetical protein